MCILLFATRSKCAARKPSTILRSHTTTQGSKSACTAKVPKTLSIKIEPKVKAIPSVKLIPIPPRLFIEDTATPIIVSINTEIGILHLL